MDRENNSKKYNKKPKFVSSTPNTYNNIQPRVVLQKLGKDYTPAAGQSSDNQPSISGLNRNQKQSGVVTSASRKAGENSLNIGNNERVIPSTSNSNPVSNARGNGRDNGRGNGRGDGRGSGVIEFKVAELAEADPDSSSGDDNNSGFSYDSSPREVVILDDNNSDTEEHDEMNASEGNSAESSIPPLIDIREHYSEVPPQSAAPTPRQQSVTRRQTKVQKAIEFLDRLISSYSRPCEENTTEGARASTSGQHPTGRRITRVPRRPKCNNLTDCIVRVRLPVCGERRKKFHIRLSHLINLLRKRSHPLHRFSSTLTIQSINYLTNDEIGSLAKVLTDFVCAKPVYL